MGKEDTMDVVEETEKAKTPKKLATPKKTETPMKSKETETPKTKTPKPDKTETANQIATPKTSEPKKIETPQKVATPKKTETPQKTPISSNKENLVTKLESGKPNSATKLAANGGNLTVLAKAAEVEAAESYNEAVNDVISGTNDVIDKMRKELATRKESMAKTSLVAVKQIPRQKPKSGKFWKEERVAFRSLKKDQGHRLTFEQRIKRKEEKLKNEELAKLLLQRKNDKKAEMRKKIEDNKAKKTENERKSEQYQIINNPAKIKRMKKKQLRMLEKRDILVA